MSDYSDLELQEQLMNQLEEMQTEIEQYRQTITDLQAEVSQKDSQALEAVEQAESFSKELERTQSELMNTKKKYSLALSNLEKLNSQLEQARQSANSSQVQELVSTVQQQKKKIAEQAELIEKLNESDLIVKENEKLKKENSSLQESVRSTKLHSEITVQACKKEYDSKMKKLKEQKEKADNDTRVAQELLKGAQERINAKAYELNLETEMRLKSEYNNQIYAFYSVLIGLLLYGLLTTVFTAVRSNVFRSDFKAFFVVVWQIICVCETNVIELGQVVSQLGNKIPLPIISTIIHYLLLIALIGGITVVLVFLVIKELKKLYKAYKDNYADVKSLTEVLISLAVAVYFAEPIRSVLPINLILLVIIAHGIYISVRFARDNFS